MSLEITMSIVHDQLMLICYPLATIVIFYEILEKTSLHLGIYDHIRKVKFTFRRIENSVKKINGKIRGSDSNFTPDLIIGLGGEKLVGGPIIASLLASKKFLNVQCLCLDLPRNEDNSINWDEYKVDIDTDVKKIESHLADRGRRILIVDDISKTGDTVEEMKNRLEEKLSKTATIKFAALVVCKKSFDDLGPDFWKKGFYYKCKVKKKVKFPWDF